MVIPEVVTLTNLSNPILQVRMTKLKWSNILDRTLFWPSNESGGSYPNGRDEMASRNYSTIMEVSVTDEYSIVNSLNTSVDTSHPLPSTELPNRQLNSNVLATRIDRIT